MELMLPQKRTGRKDQFLPALTHIGKDEFPMRADRVHSTPPPTTSHDDTLERQLFELIMAHAIEPAPFVLWLADRIASHKLVVRLRLIPTRPTGTFRDSCRAIAADLIGRDDA
jgi:hypothetical protein